jgi:hypothetical protein
MFFCPYLSYHFQVWIVGEKIGEGIGSTRKEAQRQAAEISLRNLASKFVLYICTRFSSFLMVIASMLWQPTVSFSIWIIRVYSRHSGFSII